MRNFKRFQEVSSDIKELQIFQEGLEKEFQRISRELLGINEIKFNSYNFWTVEKFQGISKVFREF